MPQADIAQDLKDYLSQSATITTDAQLRNYVKTTSRTLAAEGYPIRTSLDEAQAYIGQEVGITKWFPITQKRVNRFAESIGDYQFLHIDNERTSRETCYSGTIAHGMLTMSLLPTFATYATLKIRGTKQCIIYGMDRVRYLNPVPIGARIRGRFTLLSAEERSANDILMRHAATIEIEGQEKPALIADWIVLVSL